MALSVIYNQPDQALLAEGLEFLSHETFLTEHGCEYAQGFYYSKPVTADKINKMFVDSDEDETLQNNIKLVSK